MSKRSLSTAVILATIMLLSPRTAPAQPSDEAILPSSFLGVNCGGGPVGGVGLMAVCHQDEGVVTVASIGFDVPPMDSDALRGHWDTQYGNLPGHSLVSVERFVRPDAGNAHALRIAFDSPAGRKYYWASWHADRYTRVMVTPHGSQLPDDLNEQVMQTFFNQHR